MRQIITGKCWSWTASLFVLSVGVAVWLSAEVVAAQAIVDDLRTTNYRVFEFAESGVTFDADFEGARLCDVICEHDSEYRVVIRPENKPINDSAWYAFRVTAETRKAIAIHLTYEGGTHRYDPQVSEDGTNWRKLARDRYHRGGGRVTLQVELGPEPIWISAQEMIGIGELNAWTDKVARLPFVAETVIGQSVGGRPIRQLMIGTGEPKYSVVIVGRQHPPEVTGSMALIEFVETIAGPSALAKRFRESFETLVVPLANPDGVAAGNWRHNLNGVDLNRDWGPFRQPETRAIRDSILRYKREETPRVVFLLDFHSTHNDVFYVQTGEEPVWTSNFGKLWLDALAAKMPDYRVRRESKAGTRPLSKVWGRQTMKVPAIIYEVGDDTERALILSVARTAAKEMMRLLLDEVADNEPPKWTLGKGDADVPRLKDTVRPDDQMTGLDGSPIPGFPQGPPTRTPVRFLLQRKWPSTWNQLSRSLDRTALPRTSKEAPFPELNHDLQGFPFSVGAGRHRTIAPGEEGYRVGDRADPMSPSEFQITLQMLRRPSESHRARHSRRCALPQNVPLRRTCDRLPSER